MFINRAVKRATALVLAGAAVAVAAEVAAQPVAAQSGPARLCTNTNARGYPGAVPPILPPPPCSALPAIMREEVG
jgi:hypothetical protein